MMWAILNKDKGLKMWQNVARYRKYKCSKFQTFLPWRRSRTVLLPRSPDPCRILPAPRTTSCPQRTVLLPSPVTCRTHRTQHTDSLLAEHFCTTALNKTIPRKSCSVYFCLRTCNERFTRLFTKKCELLHIVQLLRDDRWRWRNQGNNHESSMETSKYIKHELSVHQERTKITDLTICVRNVWFPLCVKTLWMKLFRKAKYNTRVNGVWSKAPLWAWCEIKKMINTLKRMLLPISQKKN